ncbi:MAG: hypothetical protein ACTSXT_16520 [Candidatus Helarchaeota archaeon]
MAFCSSGYSCISLFELISHSCKWSTAPDFNIIKIIMEISGILDKSMEFDMKIG